MKQIARLVFIMVLLSSCHGTKDSVDEKIRESIRTYLTTGLSPAQRPNIDSIAIISIDTLTEKNCVKISLDRHYNMLKNLNAVYASQADLLTADSLLLGSLKMQKALYDRNGEKYDDASLRSGIVKMHDDSLQLVQSRQDVKKTITTIDSLSLRYASSDSLQFYAYYVSAQVYLHGAEPEGGNYIISKDYKASR